ncbi:uncharacterized protein LOC102712173 [Oryza brachyantha]|uniref:uncharacterized protein LOC102712173 n=1 Tax=Oryza brachyantha TaxID=4533 RepID=UPI001AD9D197|nr:uncharacterized protein LOC102712173 [Oryza brachyantha]
MAAPGFNLPADLFGLIYDRLPCPVDRLHMRQVCHNWRTAVTPPAPRPLPSIFLPRAGALSFSCVFSGCATHRLKLWVEDARRARYFGSFDGGWVFFAIGRPHGHTLQNLLADHSFKLPSLFFLRNGCHIPLVILAATLSSPPVHGKSVIGAIVSSRRRLRGTERQLAFWRLGQCDAIDKTLTPTQADLEDIIFHKKSFHVLDEQERVRAYTPLFDRDGNMEECHTEWPLSQMRRRHYEEHVAARYLVESRDELLMVVRLTPHHGQPTSAFRVFQMVYLRGRLHRNAHILGSLEHTWNELHKLDGRVLFVGRGCSRSHEVADHAGFEEGVYFLDDGSFRDGDKDELLFQNSDQLQFSCTDSGRWSAPTRQIESLFPEQAPSNYSPPVWIRP